MSEKNERHLSLVTHSFSRLSQSVCLINTHILIYCHARYICKLWKVFDFITFFGYFSYIIDEYSCLKYCIFTKHSQIVCLTDIHILVCQHVKCDCWLWKVFYLFFFIYTFKPFLDTFKSFSKGKHNKININ